MEDARLVVHEGVDGAEVGDGCDAVVRNVFWGGWCRVDVRQAATGLGTLRASSRALGVFKPRRSGTSALSLRIEIAPGPSTLYEPAVSVWVMLLHGDAPCSQALNASTHPVLPAAVAPTATQDRTPAKSPAPRTSQRAHASSDRAATTSSEFGSAWMAGSARSWASGRPAELARLGKNYT